MSILLREFEGTFRGHPYIHRRANTGDKLAALFYEDLFEHSLQAHPKGSYVRRIQKKESVINTPNRVTGRRSRRADGTLGARVPVDNAEQIEGRHVARAPIATLQVGIEFKIMATKMTAQMDRVATDLRNQANELKQLNANAIRVAIVGVNHASAYEGYEGTRVFRAKRAPAAEAAAVIEFIVAGVESHFDELIVLRFAATNIAPFPFDWIDLNATRRLYSAANLRVGDLFQQRFA
jgi:hypothetical protein